MQNKYLNEIYLQHEKILNMKHELQGVEGYVAWFYLLSNFHRTRGNDFYYGRKKHDLFIYPSIRPKSRGEVACVGFDFFAFWSSHHVPNVFLNKFSMMFLTCFSCSLCVPQDVPNSTTLHIWFLPKDESS
jgi:hypothetical protein